jgi:transcriptional regulator with XRE-family HTH domain
MYYRIFNMEGFSKKIKLLRSAQGWTQEELARNLGVTLNTVQRWEMGKNKPSPLAMEKIQSILKEISDGDQLKLF